MKQEVIYQTDEYRKYLMSLKHLGVKIFMVLLGSFTTFMFVSILPKIKEPKLENIMTMIILCFTIFVTGVIGIFLLIYSIIDAVQGKVRVKIISAEKIIEKKRIKYLHYYFNGQELTTSLPKGWDIQVKLPQKAKIWVAYYTKSVLRIEFLESGEIYDVLQIPKK
ncbi:MAG: hypothetical protein NZ455_07985 [Bacteroidia bacterium]|nr:hypothetical protein [Bacteroidia bacterium]MDW8345937.1 hypothetical protein [Bacteroidia bacterium]